METRHGIQTLTRGEAATLDQCAEWPVIIRQWEGPNGEQRGVIIRALTFRQRMAAEQAATDRAGKVSAWRVMAEEVAAGVIAPAGLTVDALLDWNFDVVAHIHAQILSFGGYAPARVGAELARLAGMDGEPEPDLDGVGGDDGAATGGAA